MYIYLGSDPCNVVLAYGVVIWLIMCFPAETIHIWTSQGAELEVDIYVVEGCDKAGEQLNNFRKAWITAAVNANGDAVVACSWFLGMTSLYLLLEFVIC